MFVPLRVDGDDGKCIQWVSNIIRIARITNEFICYTLLVDQGRLVFCDSQVISDLFACKHRLYLLVNFCSQDR